jgi:xanthine dehydrogenase accessory factor
MSDLGVLLVLWREASRAGDDYVLATVAHVEGSSYRKPGARMLLTSRGRRAGAISGGCLEGEVIRKAWWLTENGPVVRRYSTFFDSEGEIPYGLGCGGAVDVLLERRSTAEPLLRTLADCWDRRSACAVATVIGGGAVGRRAIVCEAAGDASELERMAARTLTRGSSLCSTAHIDGAECRVFAEFVPPRPALAVFGAGDDAQPLLQIAGSLGWYCAVADGRAHLATRERFPAADFVSGTDSDSLRRLDLRPTDAAVLMTHSYEQDGALLRHLLPLPLRYLGVLGPRRRTHQLVAAAAAALGLDPDTCMARVHGPVGLNLGSETPAEIALAIAAEIQAELRLPARAHPAAPDPVPLHG